MSGEINIGFSPATAWNQIQLAADRPKAATAIQNGLRKDRLGRFGVRRLMFVTLQIYSDSSELKWYIFWRGCLTVFCVYRN
jgi:hypothetical protein